MSLDAAISRIFYKMADANADESINKSDKSHEVGDKEQAEKPTNEEKSTSKEVTVKIDVLLKAAGDAPIMKKKKWAVSGNKTVAFVVEFIRKRIKCSPAESLFLYVNQCFVPYPDQLIQNLYECFGADGKLVLYYCKTQAWG
ncbi:autophagy protein 12-like isoform X2 [Xenia sp. Carnegie-2017]|uniref:autophagy protein 12-like isoform X2 n=1 Tax=Xenia sp. Carnegie-2017 TaxID=2897299 RepID=UPI001F0493C7|nr:autophagy protein 12-like isoform X2 [Xenia sp. Carnegie-2017]